MVLVQMKTWSHCISQNEVNCVTSFYLFTALNFLSTVTKQKVEYTKQVRIDRLTGQGKSFLQ